MKKNNKLAQKGGMMIEALAMLGLIAVVTPTMYKKSAERTLEVEDINTATTMRSVMTAADSYVSSHYGELIQEISANSTNNRTKTLSTSDLQPYLPYGFNADKLYDFGEPQVSVVRNGNNLTAFVLFPAKEDGENGLGQERTVRIATLVGANGGYVNGDQTAKGIGGIWNLSKTDFQTVFGSTDTSKPEVYSIVTASTDAINNTNTEEDTDKFLYRTAANGLWHNTMRADLYMGGNTDEHDGYDASDPKSQPFSIRNIKSLIVGTQNAGDENAYGLYINSGENNTNDAAFIKGSLEAVNSQFKVDDKLLSYMSSDDITFEIGKRGQEEGGLFLYSDSAYGPESGTLKLAHSISEDGDIKNYGDQVNLAQGWGFGEGGTFTVGNTGSPTIFAEDDSSGNQIVRLLHNGEFTVNNHPTDGTRNDVIVMMNNVVGTEKGDSNSWNKTISYNSSPVFPVRVGSNAKVDGILATAQLDTQNIRAATLEVGSTNIDDADKWLKVDANGIHGSHVDNDNNNAVFEVHKDFATMGVGDAGLTRGLDFGSENNGDRNILFMKKGRGVDLASTKQINIYTRGSGGATPEININTDDIQEEFDGKNITFSSKEPSDYSTNVKIQKTNFEVQDTGNNLVFEVKGNTNSPITENSNDKYDVAVHGRAVFTSGVNNNPSTGRQSPDRVYMNISDNLNSNAIVNIVQDNQSSTENEGIYKEILTIDGDGEPWTTSSTGTNGTVYIRKGMLEIKPITKTAFEDQSKYYNDQDLSADTGYGVIKASRFVANNPNINNDAKAPSAVPEFFTGNDYTDYNGASSTRYDTYMVNPAYTSVMHDIKLTTRGGARLSDILPDFINKGIYITSNTYKDDIKKMSFKFDSSSKKVVPAGTGDTATPLSGSIVLGNSDSWASPYLGFVPAPQCPPGYNRVITMAPQSFMMAQAGQMQKGTNPREAAYYVKNQVPDSTAFDHYTDTVTQNGAYVQQAFVAPSVSENSEVTTGGTANTRGKKITGANGSTTAEYFLASFGDQTVPLTIQQSTWLKTNVIPVDNTGSSYSVGDTNSGHTVGWAALMGFVYDAATYQTVIDKLSGNIQYNNGNNNVYWNVFPVRRNTLEAYATTYCYFDRNNIGGNWSTSSDFTSDKYIDHYNALTDYGDYTEQKHIDNSYKERLNDPTLKYDEVW
jgi:hypothetical protein